MLEEKMQLSKKKLIEFAFFVERMLEKSIKGLLKKDKPDIKKAKKSIEIAYHKLDIAKRTFNVKIYEVSIVNAYASMFHAARALLFKDGVKEKSHYGLFIYIKEKYIDKIDEMGGSVEAIKKGYIQREIRRSAYNYQKKVDSGEQVIVGVNKFATEEEPELELFEIDEKVEKKQVERLKRLRSERDNEKVSRLLDEVRQVASSEDNIMPVLIEAVKAYATVGEISDAMRDVFGEYKEATTV